MGLEVMLRVHLLQQWFGLSDPTMEEALHDVPLYREFAGLVGPMRRLPDESTILRFRHLLEEHKLGDAILATVNVILQRHGLILKAGTVVDATLISAPSSTKNQSGERDPDMHQAKKGNQWYFGMKAHVGSDAESGLVHTVVGTAANVNDVTRGHDLLHSEESTVFADAGYQGAMNRPEATGVPWHVAMRPVSPVHWTQRAVVISFSKRPRGSRRAFAPRSSTRSGRSSCSSDSRRCASAASRRTRRN
jgi:IS5 family transposase